MHDCTKPVNFSLLLPLPVIITLFINIILYQIPPSHLGPRTNVISAIDVIDLIDLLNLLNAKEIIYRDIIRVLKFHEIYIFEIFHETNKNPF